jgi:hypothetical protein
MIRLSQIAAPVALGAALFLGVPGCTHDRADEIPASATELSTGTKEVTATAPHDGMVYVWDQTANRMLYTGKVERGDTLRVDAKNNKIFFDDKMVTKRDDLTDDHHYKIFFDQKDIGRDRERTWNSGQAYTAQPAQSTVQPQPQVNVQVQPQVQPQPQPQPQVQPQPQQPAAGTTVYPPSQSNPNTTVVVPDSSNSGTGTTVVVPPPPAPQR